MLNSPGCVSQSRPPEIYLSLDSMYNSSTGKVLKQLGQAGLRPQGLDWFVGPEYIFGVFSKSRFASPALSSVDDPK